MSGHGLHCYSKHQRKKKRRMKNGNWEKRWREFGVGDLVQLSWKSAYEMASERQTGHEVLLAQF